jgi:signal transduction histidine kinase
MSSTNAAPVVGRIARGVRVVDFARQQERRRIARHLAETTQRTLEVIAGASDDVCAADLERLADAEACRLREYLEHLASAGSHRDAAAAARHEIRVAATCVLHDTTLQVLEYMSTDGYGADLAVSDLRRLAKQALADLSQRLDRLGEEERCDLVSGIQRVIDEARLFAGGPTIELALGQVDGSVRGADAAALVAAVREALNNVRKHSRATRVLISCEVNDGEAHITVRDNGVGVDPCALGGGMGVRQSIFQRMTTRGGSASLDSAPGQGVIVTLKMANGGPVA